MYMYVWAISQICPLEDISEIRVLFVRQIFESQPISFTFIQAQGIAISILSVQNVIECRGRDNGNTIASRFWLTGSFSLA